MRSPVLQLRLSVYPCTCRAGLAGPYGLPPTRSLAASALSSSTMPPLPCCAVQSGMCLPRWPSAPSSAPSSRCRLPFSSPAEHAEHAVVHLAMLAPLCPALMRWPCCGPQVRLLAGQPHNFPETNSLPAEPYRATPPWHPCALGAGCCSPACSPPHRAAAAA